MDLEVAGTLRKEKSFEKSVYCVLSPLLLEQRDPQWEVRPRIAT